LIPGISQPGVLGGADPHRSGVVPARPADEPSNVLFPLLFAFITRGAPGVLLLVIPRKAEVVSVTGFADTVFAGVDEPALQTQYLLELMIQLLCVGNRKPRHFVG
jgi:hypothetical protein